MKIDIKQMKLFLGEKKSKQESRIIVLNYDLERHWIDEIDKTEREK